MKILALLRAVSLPYLRRERGKVVLSLVGMSLGIAVFGAVRMASTAASESLSRSEATVSGLSELHVHSPAGEVDERLISVLERQPFVATVSPRSSRFAWTVPDDGPSKLWQLVGIDLLAARSVGYIGSGTRAMPPEVLLRLLRSDDSALAAPSVESRSEREVTLAINGRPHRFSLHVTADSALAGIFGGNVMILDISQFQSLFGVQGTVDVFDVKLAHGVDIEEATDTLAALLPDGIEVTRSEALYDRIETMSGAFRENLNFLSVISLFAGMLLIINTVSYTALVRRREFALLGCLGVSPRTSALLLIVESCLLGMLASVVGTGLAVLLASFTLPIVERTMTALYSPVSLPSATLSVRSIGICLVLGPCMAALGGVGPAIRSGRVTARARLSTAVEDRDFSPLGWLAFAAVLLILSAWSLRPSFLQNDLHRGFVAPLALFAAAVLLAPTALVVMMRALKLWAVRVSSASLLLAVDHVRMTLKRNAVCVASILVTTGLYLGISVMVSSFRYSVGDWIEHITRADLYISPKYSVSATSSTNFLDPRVVAAARALPELRDIDWVTSKTVVIGGLSVRVSGVRMSIIDREDRLLFKFNMDRAARHEAARKSDSIFVSETLANRLGIRLGDRLTVPGARRAFTGRVANIYFDYSTDQGAILMPDEQFVQLDGEQRKQGVSLYLKDGAKRADVLARLIREFPDQLLDIRDAVALRQNVLRVFDQTFAITYALQCMAIVIAGLTILSNLSMLFLERARELGVLRAIGASGSVLARMVLAEASLLSITGIAGGLVLGTVLAYQLVYVINPFFFGWTVTLVFPWKIFVSTGLLLFLLSSLLAFIPALRIGAKIDGSVLRYE